MDFAKGDNSAYQILSKSFNTEPVFDAAAKSVTVPANCYVVIGSKDLAEVEGVIADEADSLRVWSVEGGIEVANVAGAVTVYSIDGAKVATISENGQVALGAGLYVVRGGSKTFKVIVR